MSPLGVFLALGAALAVGGALLVARPEGRGSGDLAGWMEWYLRRFMAACQPGAAARWYRWALQAREPGMAVACLEEAARRGHREAQFELGLFCEEAGLGPGGRDQAARHYRAAAERDHPEAAFRLAELLRWGIGPARDPGAALRWYQRSANLGFRPAMDWLVRAHEFGDGVAEDLEKAVYWTIRARALPPSGLRVSRLAGALPAGRADGPRLLPAASGPPGEPYFRMGMSFLGGDGNPRDPGAARIWLLRAAEAGHVEAMAELGDLLAAGGGDDARQAGLWFQRAGQAGHPGAQIRLGRLTPPAPGTRPQPMG